MKSLNINELSVEQKIGQLFVVRKFIDDEDRKFVYEMLEKRSVGGIQVPCTKDGEEEIKEIMNHADYPVLICNDMEKGFPMSQYNIPSMMSLAVTGDTELAYQVGAVTAIEAKKRGFNTVWGPVVDMKSGNAMCTIPRIMGSDAELVSKMAAAMIRGFHDNGLMATAKHWAGATDISRDGHVFKNVSNLTEEDLSGDILKPYLYAMENANLQAVMTGHTQFINIDEKYPPTLSKKIVGILRNHGFDGLLFTDSFAMIGILQRFGEDACYGLAIKAGNDMVLPNYRTPFKTSYEYMLKAYKEGVFTEERLNDAVRRVINAQNFVMGKTAAKEISDYQKECFARIEKDSICTFKDEGVTTKLSDNTKKLFVIMCENFYKDESGELYEISDNCGISEAGVSYVKESILKRFPNSEIQVINQYPSILQIENVCNAATKADEVIYITYTSSNSYRIGENLTENVVNLMDSMDDKISAIVHLGNPYAMERVPHVPRILISVGGKEKIAENMIAALAGEYEPKGKLPLKLELK